MKIIVNIGGESSVAMTEENLAALNKVLASTPLVNRYDDKEQPLKRLKLEATLVVKSRTYDVAE